MGKTVSRQRRSPLDWGLRLLLAGAVGGIGTLCVMQSAALTLAKDQLEEAYALAPHNGRIAGRLSQSLYRPDASEVDRERAVAIARKAVRYEPTAAEAVAILAADALVRGQRAEGEQLLAFSQHISRRDFRTQILAAELAVSRDDIAGALRHYDVALRTKKQAADLLFPLLTSALAEPAIRSEMVKVLTNKPIWASAFMDHIAGNSADIAPTAAFMSNLQTARITVPDTAVQAVIARLVAEKMFDQAWTVYAAARAGSDRTQSRDPAFTAAPPAPAIFDWIAINTPSISAAILPDQTNGLFDFSVAMGHGGDVLRQFQMLPAGDYVVTGRSSGIEQPRQSQPYWSLRCQGGNEIGRIDIQNSSQAEGHFQGRLTVPANCPAQMLVLIARSSDDIGGVSGQIHHIEVRPARTGAAQ
jgi:hypothetical protein